MNITARAGIKELTIEAVLTKADGTVIDLGTIASYKRLSILDRIMEVIKKWQM